MVEENFVERLRQPLNNIGLLTANLQDLLEITGVRNTQTDQIFVRIAYNIQRLDRELLEYFKATGKRFQPIVIDKLDLREVSLMPDGTFQVGGRVEKYHKEDFTMPDGQDDAMAIGRQKGLIKDSFYIDSGGYQRGLIPNEASLRERIVEVETENHTLKDQIQQLSTDLGWSRQHLGEMRCAVCHRDLLPEQMDINNPWIVLEGKVQYDGSQTFIVVCDADWKSVTEFSEEASVQSKKPAQETVDKQKYQEVMLAGQRVIEILFTVAYERGLDLQDFAQRFKPDAPEEVRLVELHENVENR